VQCFKTLCLSPCFLCFSGSPVFKKNQPLMGDGELMLTVLSSFAHAESKDISDNIGMLIFPQRNVPIIMRWIGECRDSLSRCTSMMGVYTRRL